MEFWIRELGLYTQYSPAVVCVLAEHEIPYDIDNAFPGELFIEHEYAYQVIRILSAQYSLTIY